MPPTQHHTPYRTRATGFCVASLAILSLAFSSAPGQTPPGEPPDAPTPQTSTAKLKVSTTTWDFGEKWTGEPAESNITLSNIGDAPLDLDVKTSCGCTVAALEKKTLQPGESEDVKVSYSTKKRTGKVSQTIRVNSNDPASPVTTITVTGQVKPLLQLSNANGLDFGTLGHNDVVSKSVDIECAYSEPLDLKLGELRSKNFDVQLEVLEAGHRYRLVATTKPPLPDGLARADAVLHTGVDSIPETTVRVWGNVQNPVAVTPRQLYVPSQATAPTQYTLRVTTRRERPLKITGVTASDARIDARILPAASTQRATSPRDAGVTTIRVTLPPAAELPPGEATITIATDDEEYPQLVVPIIRRGTPGKSAGTAHKPGAIPAAAAPGS